MTETELKEHYPELKDLSLSITENEDTICVFIDEINRPVFNGLLEKGWTHIPEEAKEGPPFQLTCIVKKK